ncbi:MAG: hypothetical protein IT385_25375 [Deltaproteobacteria bacterium]|nr:hypothetical protein [Deltaproteobacteria bacterium]
MRYGWGAMLLGLSWGCASAPPAEVPPVVEAPPVTPEAPTPAALRDAVPGLTGVVQLSVGDEHACAVVADGEVRCWGSGATMRLGNGRLEARTTPDRVRAVDPARGVVAGANMSCALERDGEAWCWGGYRRIPDDPDGMLEAQDARPILVAPPIVGVRALAVGWGQVTLLDGGGRLSIIDSYGGPVPLDAFAPAVEVVALSKGFCARDAEGRVECVGTGDSGELGHGGGPGGWGEEPARVLAPIAWSETLAEEIASAGTPLEAPCAVDEGDPLPHYCQERLGGAVDIDAHDILACAALGDGRVACWGCADCWEEAGASPLGLGAGAMHIPRLVPGITDAKMIAVGERHVCYVTKSNVTKCWGDNFEGQLGASAPTTSATPIVVGGVGEVVALDAGAATTCALRADRTVTCWGRPLGAPGKERPDPDAEPATAWSALPTYQAEAPVERGAAPPAPNVCRDVDVFRRDDPLETVTYHYDRKGRVAKQTTRTTREDGPFESSVSYTYDRAGRVMSEKRRNTEDDTLYRYTHDAKGRIASESGSWRGLVRWHWVEDGAQEIGTSTDFRQEVVTRDAEGREVKRRLADGDHREASDTETVYDPEGRVALVRETSYPFPFFDHPSDVWETRYTYDEASRKVKSEESRRQADGTWLPWRTTVHLYTGCK